MSVKENEISPLLRQNSHNDIGYGCVGSSTRVDGKCYIDGHPHAGSGEDEESQKKQDKGKESHEGLPAVKAQLRYIMPGLGLGIFLAAMDQTIVVSCYGKIGSELKALDKTSWVATAYFLTLTSFQPLYGKLSDIFGRKPVLLFAYGVFGLGCLFCGLARNIHELIAARAFAGIGGGGMTTIVSIMMSDIVPLRERGTWQGILNIIYAAGSGCGAPLGGVLADYLTWRWAFLAQVPLCGLVIATVGIVLQLPKKDKLSWRKNLQRIDFLGALVLILTVFTLLFGLDRGSNVAWSDNSTVFFLSIAPPLLALFVFIELRLATEPFAPPRIIFDRSLLACYLCNLFGSGGWFSVNFYLPLFFQAVDRFSATQAGVRLLPGILAGVLGSLVGGLVIQRTGRYYWLTVASYSGLVIGMIAIALSAGVLVNSTYGIAGGLLMGGFGQGAGQTTTLIGMIANASPEDQAAVTACSYLFRSLGSVVGLSLSSTVIQQSLRTQLTARLERREDTEHIIQQIRESLDYIKTLEPGMAEVVQKCYAVATRNGFMLMFGFAVMTLPSSWFIKEKRLR